MVQILALDLKAIKLIAPIAVRDGGGVVMLERFGREMKSPPVDFFVYFTSQFARLNIRLLLMQEPLRQVTSKKGSRIILSKILARRRSLHFRARTIAV